MPEVVKSPAMIIIALAVFLLILFFIFELLFSIKIGRAVCKFVGGILLQITGYTGIFVGITQTGIDAACNLLFF